MNVGGKPGSGLGSVRIINGTDHDAVAVLVKEPGNKPLRAIYVRNNESGSITRVENGKYILQFRIGSAWQVDRTFCNVFSTNVFDDILDFDQRPTDQGIEYSEWEVTLNPVPGGNAPAHEIPDSKFVLPPI